MRTHLPPGEALVEELKWVHWMIRRDLGTVRRLAEEVADGLPASVVGQRLGELPTNGPLWQLRVNCLRYCSLVHHHHQAESAQLFPALRRSNPALGPVVDKLEDDHKRVSGLLDDVEDACRSLAVSDGAEPRQLLVGKLRLLAEDLLAHLDYEEEHVSPTLRTWTGWPR